MFVSACTGYEHIRYDELGEILRECRNGARKSVELDALADPLPEKSSALTVGYETPDKKWRIPKRISSIALRR